VPKPPWVEGWGGGGGLAIYNNVKDRMRREKPSVVGQDPRDGKVLKMYVLDREKPCRDVYVWSLYPIGFGGGEPASV